MRKANKVKIIFYSSGGWESDYLERVDGGGGTDLMFQFRLERKDDEMKHYQDMKQSHRARIGSIGRKHYTGRW
jgi:hypothetical protein